MTQTSPAAPDAVRARLDALVRLGIDWGAGRGRVPRSAPDSRAVPGPRSAAAQAVRPAAVLVLFGALEGRAGHDPGDIDVLLVERAASLGHHPGQIAFPGGRLDPDDTGPVGAALREATEETGLDADGVEVVGTLAGLPLPVSNHLVTPVLGWWARPSPVGVVDHGECAAVFRVPVSTLLDPENRRLGRVTRGRSSFDSPAFVVEDRVVWGFTGIVLDRVLDGLGWALPWERRLLDIPV
ncbi:NUDIX hydrolase [Sanguibacter antarcticus]|uniref:NUDIX domain-containing protein n=1 Tax=Sanguibacter antarcticus TaxID=372484 RepID=A0A2A9E310_9MICO|nr:CoA pyrophosphatase [Sanguibacter antarcticus]PFG32961.1 NUDIX domain-containing protein [Sanguibacter antarcticus]